MQQGDIEGVFPVETNGARDLLKRLQPDGFRDLVALNALDRPGPLSFGMADAYVNRKHGREKTVYFHPIMEEVLAETHGLLCYQEQAMMILDRLGGVALDRSYNFIKAVSQRREQVIDLYCVEFLAGAQKRGVDPEAARLVFDFIVQNAGLSYNKSHSATYALIGYHSAHLKAHFRDEFMRSHHVDAE